MTLHRIGVSLLSASLLLSAAPVFAEGSGRTQNPTLNTTCVQTAVGTREDAIIAAVTTFNGAMLTAHQNRKTALVAAWGNTDREARRKAVKTAWETFRKAKKEALRTMRNAKKAAWKTFRETVRNTCKLTDNPEQNSEGGDNL